METFDNFEMAHEYLMAEGYEVCGDLYVLVDYHIAKIIWLLTGKVEVHYTPC